MRVRATTAAPPEAGADTVVVGLFEGEGVAHDHGGVLQALVDRGEAGPAARKLAVAHAAGLRYVLVGLGARARQLEGVQVDVLGRAEIEAAGMGAFAAVARGSDEEPHLISLRYEPPGVAGPVLGFVGKAVTFDSGGISIKPAAKMHEMKFDMSGGATVIEAMGAIARLGLPAKVTAVVAATENMPSGRSMRPGDIVTAMNGVTIEINNTDADGRLVLADALAPAVQQGAERLVA